MFSSLRAVVFDLDGTLIDSRHDIAEAVNHTLVSSGRTALPLETVASFVGDGAITLIQRATGLETDDPELTRLHDRFRAYYTAHATEYTEVYPGVRETLVRLSRTSLHVALCTNKPRQTTERVLDELELERFFDVVVCADDLPFKKPHPGPLLHIAERLAVHPSECVMVGDGPQDVLCGKAAGALTLGVTYGIKPATEVAAAGPDALIHSIDEVWSFLTTSTKTMAHASHP